MPSNLPCPIGSVCAAIAGLSVLSVPALGQTYAVSVNQAASSATYSLSVTAPIATTPALPQNAPIPMNSSYLIGGAAATPPTSPATITRPSTSFFGSAFSTNQPVAITSGSISASGDNGSSPLHPRGTLSLSINPAAHSASVSGLSVDILGGATASFAVSLSVGFQSFHTRNPNSVILIPSATIPVSQTATVTQLIANQPAGAATGTLTDGAPGVYSFAVPVQVLVSVAATLGGSDVPVDPQAVEVTLTGTINTNTTPATISANIAINNNQTQPGPTPFGSQVVDEPIYGGKLLATLVIASTTVNLTSNATISAAGVRALDRADFNGDGVVDPDDLSDFIAAFFGRPADPRADFNGDGAIDPDDLADYIAAYFAR